MSAAAADLAELMAAWETIVATARAQYPAASEEQIYQLAKGAMHHALHLPERNLTATAHSLCAHPRRDWCDCDVCLPRVLVRA